MKKNLIVLVAFILLVTMATPAFSQDAQTAFNKGMKEFRSKEYARAVPYFDEAIAYNVGFVKGYVFRGLSFFLMNEHGLAISDLNYALQRDPQNVTALFARGQAYMFIGESKRAIVDFDAVIKMQPENPWAYLQRSICYYRLGNIDKAISDSNRAISFSPRNADAFFMRAMCYWRKDKLEAASRDLKQATISAPDNSFYQLFNYVAQARTGNTSTDELRAFMEMNVDKVNEFPYYLIQMMLGNREPGDCLEMASTYEPKRLRGIVEQQTQYMVGQYYMIQGQQMEASRHMNLAMGGDTNSFLIQGLVKGQFYEFISPKREVCGELCEP